MNETVLNNNSINEPIYMNVYEVENSKGAIQIIHGMEEHKERYEDVAKFLNKKGYTVVVSDLLGHGAHAKKLGHIANKNGYEKLITQQLLVREYIKSNFSDNIILLAHSMGTIIARNILKKYSNLYNKVILTGYPNTNKFACVGLGLIYPAMLFGNNDKPSKFFEKLILGAFNKKIKNPETPIDWISYNKDNLIAYANDNLSGKGFSKKSFRDLFKLTYEMSTLCHYKNVNIDLPILLLAGEDDPCTGFEKGRCASRNTLSKAGFLEINQITYPKMRHEILNECEKNKVYEDIYNFIK